MRFIFIILFCLLNLSSSTQPPVVKQFEFYGGIGFCKPLRVPDSISFQSGSTVYLGGQVNFNINNNYYIFINANASHDVFNGEGYFINVENKDHFIITENNVKVNSLTLIPLSTGIGIKHSLPKFTIGLSVNAVYNNKTRRFYKVAGEKIDETYSFENKWNLGISGLVGFYLSDKKSYRADFIANYYASSLASNTNFNPIKLGITLTRGFGKNL